LLAEKQKPVYDAAMMIQNAPARRPRLALQFIVSHLPNRPSKRPEKFSDAQGP
jgi:hypothetical protein